MIRSIHRSDLFGLGGLLVVLLGETKVFQELGINTLQRSKLMLLDALDTILMGLAGLVMGGMVLGLGHDE